MSSHDKLNEASKSNRAASILLLQYRHRCLQIVEFWHTLNKQTNLLAMTLIAVAKHSAVCTINRKRSMVNDVLSRFQTKSVTQRHSHPMVGFDGRLYTDIYLDALQMYIQHLTSVNCRQIKCNTDKIDVHCSLDFLNASKHNSIRPCANASNVIYNRIGVCVCVCVFGRSLIDFAVVPIYAVFSPID